jgi:hypothetical protein
MANESNGGLIMHGRARCVGWVASVVVLGAAGVAFGVQQTASSTARTAPPRAMTSPLLSDKEFEDALKTPYAPATSVGTAPLPQVDYFLGESRMTTPTGKHIRTTLSLVKRIVSEADGRIEEHVLSIDEKNAARPFIVVMQVKDSKFTVTERSKSFTGEGELIGEAWKWKAWKSVTKLSSGAGTVKSEDKLTERGMSGKKVYAGADGEVRVLFEDSLDRISARTYEILYAKLAPVEKK